MAAIEPLVPFILYYEAGLTPAQADGSGEQVYERARRRGYSYHPADRGGATMCGVTLAAYRRHTGREATAAELREMDYATWLAILRQNYWERWHADGIGSQRVAEMLVDWVWASGVHGIRQPQQLLGVAADGVVGKVTLAAVNSADARTLLEQLRDARHRFVDGIVRRRPEQRIFEKGWRRRIDAIAWEGLRYV